jgi:hypothetical protein
MAASEGIQFPFCPQLGAGLQFPNDARRHSIGSFPSPLLARFRLLSRSVLSTCFMSVAGGLGR